MGNERATGSWQIQDSLTPATGLVALRIGVPIPDFGNMMFWEYGSHASNT